MVFNENIYYPSSKGSSIVVQLSSIKIGNWLMSLFVTCPENCLCLLVCCQRAKECENQVSCRFSQCSLLLYQTRHGICLGHSNTALQLGYKRRSLSKALVPNLDHIRYVSATEECQASMSFFGPPIIANLNLKLWGMEMYYQKVYTVQHFHCARNLVFKEEDRGRCLSFSKRRAMMQQKHSN